MKFQNPSLNFFLNGRMDSWTSRNQYAPHFFLWDHKTDFLAMHLSCIENISLIASVEKSTENRKC